MILVVGSTGNIGRELVRLLAERGVAYRALVRDRERATAILGAAAPLIEGDLAVPATLDAALEGVERVFLLSTNAPNQVQLQSNLVQAARRARIAQLVKVSGLRPAEDRLQLIGYWHARTEAEIRDTGLPFTFLQPGFFAQNLLLYAPSIRQEGRLATPTMGRIAFVDARDVASVAATVLTESGHAGRTYTLTGPRALTFGDAADALGKALGRRVTHEQLTYEDAAAGLRGAGLPTWMGDFILSLYRSFDEGKGEEVTTDVEQITRRPPRELAVFAQDYAPLFR